MIVVDACVAVKWFLPEPLSDIADGILLEDEVRIAPEHILVEVGNTLLKAHRAHAITLDHARDAVAALSRLIHLRPVREIADAALQRANAVGCTNYDALYVAASERWGAALVTADAKLARQLRMAGWSGDLRLLES